jgi:uncharacterized membrane protein
VVRITRKGAIILMIMCTFFASTAHLLLKEGALRIDAGSMVSFFNLPLLLGLFSLLFGAGFMMVAFKHGELSLLFPILSTGYVWVSLLTPLFFPNETMNLWKWVGVILIIISVSFLGFSSSRKVTSNA